MKYILTLVLILSLNTYADSLNIGLLGLTFHGMSSDIDYAPQMKRKIDKNGIFAHHIEFNLTYINKDNFIFNSTILKDCFDNDAYYLGIGKQWEVSENLYAHFTIGMYVRKTFAKDIDLTIGSSDGKMDYIPAPWIGLKRNFEINESWSFSTQVNTNVFLTHGTFGFEFKLP